MSCLTHDGIDGVYPWFFMAIFGLGDCKVAYIFSECMLSESRCCSRSWKPIRQTRNAPLRLVFVVAAAFFHASSVAAADCDAFDLPNVPRIWLHSVVFCSALLRSVLFCSVLVGSDLSKVLGCLAVGVRHPRHPTPHPLVILPWLMMRSVVIRSKRGKSAAEAELSNGLNPSFLFISLWAVLLC